LDARVLLEIYDNPELKKNSKSIEDVSEEKKYDDD
jgi:hypothetical protein